MKKFIEEIMIPSIVLHRLNKKWIIYLIFIVGSGQLAMHAFLHAPFSVPNKKNKIVQDGYMPEILNITT